MMAAPLAQEPMLPFRAFSSYDDAMTWLERGWLLVRGRRDSPTRSRSKRDADGFVRVYPSGNGEDPRARRRCARAAPLTLHAQRISRVIATAWGYG